eukprot:COSAG01_NODE_257_length_20101_cov_142.726427_20_plen_109_part_00
MRPALCAHTLVSMAAQCKAASIGIPSFRLNLAVSSCLMKSNHARCCIRCANGKILNDVLRRRWNRSDALITTDCGAVGMLAHHPANASTPEQQASAPSPSLARPDFFD